ncbi:hypothetical protein BJ741DRAFT_615327 [Chytriomyces cf. hyalinus JEL632]|nr:hypothetical protein BJ741DRAFT_615327 [Chytriomyces cf. hyalinus JEL632]
MFDRHFDDDEALLPYEKRAMKHQNLHKMHSSHRYVSPNRYSSSGFESAKIASATHSDKHPAPWVPHGLHSSLAETRSLDTEAQLLLDYLSPSPHETILRNHLASKYATIITQRFPSSSTHAFGSSGTGLFLPWSDVDLIVVDPGTRFKNIMSKYKTYPDPKQGTQSSKLSKLIPKLNQSQQTSSLLILRRARVPILKLCDKSTGIAIDVCYNVVGGLSAVEAVKSWVEKVEGLRDLVMLVKLFLNGKGLSDVATGGVGGYSIVVWCMAFLKIRKESPASMPELQRKRKHENHADPTQNTPGTLFLDFCRYFGRHFDYHSQGIGFTKSRDPHDPAMPHTFDKRSSIQFQKAKPFMLCLLNPLDLSVDLTRGSTRIQAVTSAFSDAAAGIERTGSVGASPEQSSSKRMRRSGNPNDSSSSNSIFSQIMFVSKEMVRQRELMHRVGLSLFGNDLGAFVEEPENDGAAAPVYAEGQNPFVLNGIAMNDNDPELDRDFVGEQSEIVADFSEDEAGFSDYENEVVVQTAITEIMSYEEDDDSSNSVSDIFFMDRSGGVVTAEPVKKKERVVLNRSSPVNQPKSEPSPVSQKSKERKKRTGFNGRDNRTTKAKSAKNQSPQKEARNHVNLVGSPAMKSHKRRHMTDDAFSQHGSKKEKYHKPNHSDWKPRNGKRREDLWDGDANFMELSRKRRKQKH